MKKVGKDFVIGAGIALDNNVCYGVGAKIKEYTDSDLPSTTPYKAGRVIGDVLGESWN